MSHLRSSPGVAGLWRWVCGACELRSRQWFLTKVEAIEAAREHSHVKHPEYHDLPTEPA
jgi:hypothetical protein